MTVQTPVLSNPNEKVKALKASIEESANELLRQMEDGKSEALVRYLEYAAKLHEYSIRNILLAIWQRPGLTQIAGLRRWNELGRRVKKGEKGIAILAPITVIPRGEEDDGMGTEIPEPVRWFKVVYVFDISQTEGDPVPDMIHATGDVSVLYPVLVKSVQDSGITLEFADEVPGSIGALGVSLDGRIVLRKDLAPADAFRVLVHEFAHERLHNGSEEKESKTIRETEADATAFIVCRHFGVACDSSDYLLLYDSTPKVLLDRLERVRATAGRIIDDLEKAL
jgi:hypothetical protein